ncbi:MAG: hypothetical protein EX272_13285 [Chromatiales bacterium]|nr:MAG: hypothetical protein EX272_13285 [Chromatiales bacterium]
MITRTKSIISLTTLSLFGLALACDASVASDRERRAAADDIRACVSEINRNIDYSSASRVEHWVVDLHQMSLAELKVRIDTTVYERGDGEILKELRSTCVTGALGDLIRFRMKEAAPPDA